MKYYTYVELGLDNPDIPEYITMSVEQILEQYKSLFLDKVKKSGRNIEAFTDDIIIDHWVIVNWAWETDSQGNKIDYSSSKENTVDPLGR